MGDDDDVPVIEGYAYDFTTTSDDDDDLVIVGDVYHFTVISGDDDDFPGIAEDNQDIVGAMIISLWLQDLTILPRLVGSSA